MIPSIDDAGVRITIWLAMLAYAATLVLLVSGKTRWARIVWTLGGTSYLLHVLLAFAQHYAWDHLAAVERTRQQTLDVTGVDTNLGLYVNYGFTLVWIADLMLWWVRGDDAYQQRRRGWTLAMHGFFVFMIVNGAIVFAQGPARWLGIGVVLVALPAIVKLTWTPRSPGVE